MNSVEALLAAILILGLVAWALVMFRLKTLKEVLVKTIEEATKAFEDYRDDVKAKVAALGTKIDELTKEIQAGNTEGADLEALVAEVNAAKLELDGAASEPVVPAP